MSNIKKTIPTLVGGAMLLGNMTAFAVEEVPNQDAQNQEIGTSDTVDGSIVEDTTIEVEVEGSENDVVKDDVITDEVKEPVDNNINKGDNTSKVETPVAPSTPDVETVVVEEKQPENQISQEEFVNLLKNLRAVSNQKVMKVNKDALIVREGSVANSSQVGTLKKGDYVDVYEQNANEGWSKINFEGKMAYVNTVDLIDVEKVNKESIEDGVIVRSGAGNSYGEFGKLTKGERVQVYQELSNGWSKVNYNGKIAFVETAKLKESYISKATISMDKVNVYETASETAKVISEAKKGEIMFIYAEEGNFYKVKIGDAFGFIKKTDLKVIENIEKPQTGDAIVFSYMGTLGVSILGMASVNRKKKK